MARSLPDLGRMSLSDVHSSVRDRWLAACGAKRPAFKRWSSLDGRDKQALLHNIAALADDESGADYVTPYDKMDMDDVLENRVWSIEHVVPRSKVNGRDADVAEDDPNGWVVATRSANSRRSNLPLMLWLDPDGQLALPNSVVRFSPIARNTNDDAHYAPPQEQRARLARKWLFIRATYSGPNLAPPTAAQKAHRHEIIALAKHAEIQRTEDYVNTHYRQEYDWANPLLEEDADRWYDDPAWRSLVFD